MEILRNSPFQNDPATMVAEAFAELFPEAKYEAAYAPEIYDDKGIAVCSCITFPNEEDGPDAVPVILVNSQLGIEVVAKAFAQELVHVALGPKSLSHGKKYDKTMKQLEAKYYAIAEERFPQEEGGVPNEEQR